MAFHSSVHTRFIIIVSGDYVLFDSINITITITITRFIHQYMLGRATRGTDKAEHITISWQNGVPLYLILLTSLPPFSINSTHLQRTWPIFPLILAIWRSTNP